jgi:ATP-binding cassette subfamily B protein
MDEPTSSLDASTETELVGAMRGLMQGRTTVIVAHRLSMIRDASRIFVLEAGRIIESGTETELLDLKGAYNRFHGLQSGTLVHSAEG